MLYFIIFAVIAFTIGLQVLANREMRVRAQREFQRDDRPRRALQER